MVVMEFSDVEVDHCPGCKGIWLDAGELELLLESDDASGSRKIEKDGFLASFKTAAGVTERRRKCPICRGKMKKVVCGPDNIVIDRCARGHGIWFDDGELRALVEAANSGAANGRYNKMAGLLKDMFKN
jgi:hypothetical protein